MRVLGIDPGLRNLGWGVIRSEGNRLTHIANGICHGDGDTLAERLLSLHRALTEVVAEFRPDAAAVTRTEGAINDDGCWNTCCLSPSSI